jgi:sugar lactone lactonase YvrE
MNRRLLLLALLLPFAFPAVGCGSKSSGGAAPAPTEAPTDWMGDLKGNTSCVLDCNPSCTEGATPWVCPAIGVDWSTLPHDPTACGTFDGKTYPTPQQGQCTATTPGGSAVEKTNASGTPPVLPDGRRVEPAGNEWLFTDFPGNFPDGALLVPGTSWLLVVDTGYTTHAVRAVDTATLRSSAGTNPVTSSISYAPPKALDWGMAYVASASLLYVASGYESPDDTASQIYAYDFDPVAGKLTADAGKSIPLPSGTFPEGLAVSPDGSTMLVGQVTDSHVLVVSLATATYGKVTGKVDTGQADAFEIRFDPGDATGNTAYVTDWLGPSSGNVSTSMRVAQLDVAGQKSTTIAVGKEPEDMAFLDARYMVIANGLSDSLAIIDRPASKVVATVPLDTVGLEPTSLAYDPPHGRLYATLASANAVEAFTVDDTQTPPSITPVGKIPTSWWPTAVIADTDGTLYVTTGRGHGTQGLNLDGDDGTYIQGSVQAVPYMDATALSAATATAEGAANVQAYDGYPTVQCNGAPYDFPVPQPASGPSSLIQHVFFIERENKTFDALFGDLPNVDGQPSYILSPQYQGTIWANARKIAAAFAHMDNYYSDAEQSIQGHYWDVFGRTSDVDERRWLVTWGRGEFGETSSPGVSDYSAPLEGSIFSDLQEGGITLENEGELVGGLAYKNYKWPGGTSADTIPDTLGGCYLAARAKVTCDLPEFVYAWLGNDHTFGLSAGYPNPALMMAVNDEATGMLLDGISHSPIWASSLVIVIEDDPSTGQDHVDMHRSIALFASPWVKRGYVSHGHYDVASLHKLIATLYGKPYRNAVIASAGLPLDMFTSTPDYTPYDFVPRGYTDGSCNPGGTPGAMKAAGWNFAHPDEQPGLGEQIRESMQQLR